MINTYFTQENYPYLANIYHDDYNSGYVVAGRIDFGTGNNAFLMNLDSEGKKNWGYYYAPPRSHRVHSFAKGCDDYYIGGWCDSNPRGFMMRFSLEGSQLWNIQLENCYLFDIIISGDCNPIFSCDNYVIKVSQNNGSIIWKRKLTQGAPLLRKMLKKEAGEDVVNFLGASDSISDPSKSDIIIGGFREEDGRVEWISGFGYQSNDEAVGDFVVTSENEVITVGRNGLSHTCTEFILSRFYSNGTGYYWSKSISPLYGYPISAQWFFASLELTKDETGVVLFISTEYAEDRNLMVSRYSTQTGELVWAWKVKDGSELSSGTLDNVYGSVSTQFGFLFVGAVAYSGNGKVFVASVDEDDGILCEGEDYASSMTVGDYNMPFHNISWWSFEPMNEEDLTFHWNYEYTTYSMSHVFTDVCISCYGVLDEDVDNVCGGDGGCVDWNDCNCNDPMFNEQDTYCEVFSCNGINFNSSAICNFHNGTCEVPGFCDCHPGYYGNQCFMGCFGFESNDTINVCSGGNGVCIEPDTCHCQHGYYGVICNVTICHGILSNDTEVDVCSGRGNCFEFDKCECDVNYYGVFCNVTVCNGFFSNETDSKICSDRGRCIEYGKCICDQNYFGEICNITTCNQVYSNDSYICSGGGTCSYYENCDCDPNYFGEEDCNITKCDGEFSNVTSTCTDYGTCWPYEICQCQTGYFGESCNITTCFDVFSNSSSVCSEHGICWPENICACPHSAKYFGPDCNYTWCDGNPSNISSSEVCGGHGTCWPFEKCNCFPEYFGTECEVTTCDGVFSNVTDTSELCHSHGNCIVDTQICECFHTNYSGLYCQHWDCFSVDSLEEDDVCSGHGDCLDVDKCSCVREELYSGENCEIWKCGGKLSTDVDEVCSGHGSCVDVDLCYCIRGYSTKDNDDGSESQQEQCSEWSCGEYHKDDEDVCNRRGICTESHKCECNVDKNADDGYEGDLCEKWRCRGLFMDHPFVCSGNGECVSPEVCNCKSGYYGETCGGSSIVVVSVSIGVTIGFVCIICLFCSFIVCCYCILCCIMSVTICLLLCGRKQASNVKRFSELKNFEILLKEQELDEDVSIAHIRVNRKLFEISYEDITVNKMLGEGGSNAIVFLATWQGNRVAFKCFKTRMVCQSQESFTEFEKEVEVLSSISHPHIIRFYGATIRPPRVGIVMEYCEHGDLVQFLDKYKEENKCMYPLKEKLRILNEVSQAMEYLHERNIIHRDLKLENVLVDSDERSILMDFGLSTIVERMSQAKTSRIGTNIYMSPEIFLESRYTEKCDVFSFGVFVFILLTEVWEPYGEDAGDVHIEVRVSSDPKFRPPLRHFRNQIPTTLDWLKELMVKCWCHNEEERPSFGRIQKEISAFLSTTAFSSLEYVKEEKEAKMKLEILIRNTIKELAILKMTFEELAKSGDDGKMEQKEKLLYHQELRQKQEKGGPGKEENEKKRKMTELLQQKFEQMRSRVEAVKDRLDTTKPAPTIVHKPSSENMKDSNVTTDLGESEELFEEPLEEEYYGEEEELAEETLEHVTSYYRGEEDGYVDQPYEDNNQESDNVVEEEYNIDLDEVLEF